jgi:photosystem II stability/assembly factor-like uncharacterized protein
MKVMDRMKLVIATGDSIAIVEEQGETWQVRVALEGSGAQCVALDPHDLQTLYAGAWGEGIWKSTDGGVRWSNLSTALSRGHVFSVAVSPLDGALYAGCEPSAVFRSDDGGVSWEELRTLTQLPSAPTWSFPPRPETSHVRCIAPCPHDADLLLVGIELGCLARSTDGGQNWEDHRPGALPDVHAVTWHPQHSGRAYQTGGFGGAVWSDDAGVHWRTAEGGAELRYTWALAVHPTNPDCWFISDSPGPMNAHNSDNAEARILRRCDGAWEELRNGLPQPLNSLPYSLLSTHERLFAGLGDGRIFVSSDWGESWNHLQLTGQTVPSVRAMSWSE